MTLRRTRSCGPIFFRLIWAILLLYSSSSQAVDSVSWFGFEGRLFDSSGNPLNSATVSLKLQVYSASGGCLLYEETQSGLNLSSSNAYEQGVFSIKVGGGTRSGLDPGLGFSQIFSNAAGLVGAASCNYTPAASDVRYLRLSVDSGSGYETLSPDFPVLSSANAQNAQSLQGKAASDLIQVSGQITQSNVAVLVGGADASALHHHDSKYVQLGSSGSQNLGAGDVVTTGRIGIGTSTPAQSLHIKNATGTATMRLEGSAATGSALEFSAGGTVKTVIKTEGGSGNFVVVTEGQTALFIDQNGTMVTSGNQFVAGYIRPGQISTAAESSATTSLTSCGAPCSGGIWYNPTLGVLRMWTSTQGLLTAPFYSGTATSGQTLSFNGTNWVPSTPSTLDATKLPLTGGTLSGNLDLGGHNITSVGAISVTSGAFNSVTASTVTISSTPSAALDAVNKNYTDARLAGRSIASPSSGQNSQAIVWNDTTQTWNYTNVSSSFNGRSGAVTSQSNDYTWAQIDKTTSSLADLTTKSAADLSSGTLADARLSSNVPLKNSANTYGVGGHIVQIESPAVVGVTVRAAAGQTSALQQWRDNSSTVLYQISPTASPTGASDLTNKTYVDTQVSSVSSTALKKDGSVPLTASWNVGGFDLAAVGNISISAGKSLRFGAVNSASEPGLVSSFSGSEAGSVWWNSSLGQLRYWDGSSIQTVGAGAGAITSFNGQTTSVQTLTVTNSAGALSWSSASGNHELNIPTATGTTAGLLQAVDYNTFNNKQSALGYVPLNSAGGAMTGNLIMSGADIDVGGNQLFSSSLGGGATFTFSTLTTSMGAGGLTISSNSASGYKASLGADSSKVWVNASSGRSTASLYVNGVLGIEYMSSASRPACTMVDLGNVLVSDTGLEYCDGLNYRTLVTTKLQILPEHKPLIWVTGSSSLKITSSLATYPIRVSFPSGHVAELNGSTTTGGCGASGIQWCYVYADDIGSGSMAFSVSINDPSAYSGNPSRAYIGAVAYSSTLGGYIDVKKEQSESSEDTRPSIFLSTSTVYIEPATDGYPMRFSWGDDVRFAMNPITFSTASCPSMAWCYLYASRDTLVPDQVNFNVSGYPASDSSNKGRFYIGAVWNSGASFEPFNKKDTSVTESHRPVLETDGTTIYVGTADWNYPVRILFPSGEIGTGSPSAVVTNTFNCTANSWCYIYAEYAGEGEATFFADINPPQMAATNYSRKFLGAIYKTASFSKFIQNGRHFDLINQGAAAAVSLGTGFTLNIPATASVGYFEAQVSTTLASACIFELGFNYYDGALGPQIQRILFNKESTVASPTTYTVDQLRLMFDRYQTIKQIYVQQNPSVLGTSCTYSSPILRLKGFDDAYL